MKQLLLSLLRSRLVSLLYLQLHRLHVYSCHALSVAKAKALFPEAINLMMDYRVDVKYRENVSLGKNIVIGADVTIGAHSPVTIGDFVRISKGVSIESATLDIRGPLPYKHKSRPVRIDRGVWLGMNSTILGGVTIGENSVIGANAVVSRDVPPNSICVGSANRIYPKD